MPSLSDDAAKVLMLILVSAGPCSSLFFALVKEREAFIIRIVRFFDASAPKPIICFVAHEIELDRSPTIFTAEPRSASNGDRFACSRPGACRDGRKHLIAALAFLAAPP